MVKKLATGRDPVAQQQDHDRLKKLQKSILEVDKVII